VIARRWKKPEIGPARPIRRVLPSIRNVAAAYAGTGAEAVVFLLLTPFLVRNLGLAAFGLWTVALALAEWLALFDFGLREAVMKYAAAYQAREETAEVRRTADTALFLYCVLSLGVIIVGLLLGWLALPGMVDVPADLEVAQAILLLLVLSTAISLPAGLAGSLLEGLSRFDLLNLFRVLFALLRMVLIVLALQAGLGLVGLALAEVAARLALHAMRWVAIVRIDPVLMPRPWPHLEHRGRLMGFGAWNALRQAGDVILGKLYEPILALFAGLASVGSFYAGRRLASMPAEIIGPLAGVLFPLSSELEAAGREATLRQTLLNATKLATALSLPVSLVIAIGAGPIQANWLGGRAPEAEAVMRAFAIFFFLVATVMPSESILLGLGRARLLAIMGVLQATVTLGIGIPLTARHGPLGLAVGALAAISLQVIVVIPVAARGCGLSMWRLFRRAFLPPVASALPVGAALIFLEPQIAVGGLAAVATWAMGGAATYGLLLWWLGFEAEERAFIWTHFRRLVLHPSRITDWEDTP